MPKSKRLRLPIESDIRDPAHKNYIRESNAYEKSRKPKAKPQDDNNPISNALTTLKIRKRQWPMSTQKAFMGADMQEGMQIQGTFRKRGPQSGRKGSKSYI